jgi:predicted permease
LNVANLYLARSFARRRETALRLALGASRGRIVRELLVQSAMLAMAGALLGVAVAPAVIRVLLSFLPADLATIDLSADISPTVFGFALAAALVTAVLFSIAPALRSARAEPSLTLKEESSTVGAGIAMRKVLVAGQIALALVLLIGAGLFVRTLATLRAKGPGFETTNLVTMHVDTARSGYSKSDGRTLIRNVFAAVRQLPEVRHAALSTGELLSGGSWSQRLTIDAGRRFATDAVVHCNAVTPGFFETLGVTLIAGRDFTDRDADENPPDVEPGAPVAFRAAIINESTARRYFGDRNPIGARIGLGNRPDTKADIEVIGVVRTFSYRGLRETEDQAFFPFFQLSANGGMIWARTNVTSTAAFGGIRNAVHRIDPELPVKMRTMDDQLDRSLANERLLAMLASAFAGLAVLLALVGIYGVMSFVVSHRTREIGIRVALGASRGNAVWLILREATVMLSFGVAIALAAAWGLGRFVESQLFGVHATDWSTAAAAALLVVCVALTASALPVRRATSISPVRALRGE